MSLRFEYDLDKSRHNKEKHGLDFIDAQELWDVSHVLFRARTVGEELRQIIVGEILGHIHIAIFTHRNEIIRLISCHRADSKWEKAYQRALREKKKN